MVDSLAQYGINSEDRTRVLFDIKIGDKHHYYEVIKNIEKPKYSIERTRSINKATYDGLRESLNPKTVENPALVVEKVKEPIVETKEVAEPIIEQTPVENDTTSSEEKQESTTDPIEISTEFPYNEDIYITPDAMVFSSNFTNMIELSTLVEEIKNKTIDLPAYNKRLLSLAPAAENSLNMGTGDLAEALETYQDALKKEEEAEAMRECKRTKQD